MYNQRNINGPHVNGNMSIDNAEEEHEFLLTVEHINKEKIKSINESLKDMGMTLNDPDVWIGSLTFSKKEMELKSRLIVWTFLYRKHTHLKLFVVFSS
jgi:hypothetical protein